MIPSKIIIKNQEWKIEEKPKIVFDNVNCWGLCCFETRTITIRSNLSKRNKKLTYLHELLHAMSYEVDLKLSDKMDEKMAEEFSTILMDLFHLQVK